LETILQRERLLTGGCLAAIVVAAWLYLLHERAAMGAMAQMDMPGMNMPGMVMPGASMPESHQAALPAIFLLFVMWTIMMVGMMVPSASPMIMAFFTLNERRRIAARPFVPVSIFISGYLAVWAAFSAVAAVAQWRLHEAALLSPAMRSISPVLSGAVLVSAGVFQWTPLKRICLAMCRSPLSFLMREWREGSAGAFVMGLRHGAYCVGCCWVLMALLFVAGVMNLLWVAVIALFVMAEKTLPKGELLAQLAGAALVIAGITHIARLW
jgi:predicted metal-binding membrane protein